MAAYPLGLTSDRKRRPVVPLRQRRRRGDAEGEIEEVERGQRGHRRLHSGRSEKNAHDTADDDRHDRDHAGDDTGEVAETTAGAEGGAGRGEAQRRRAGAAGQCQSGQNETKDAVHGKALLSARTAFLV
jgi:hypothetical protein